MEEGQGLQVKQNYVDLGSKLSILFAVVVSQMYFLLPKIVYDGLGQFHKIY